MGEYYKWVNVDKKEYISPYEFDEGNKLYESMLAGNPLIEALYALMAMDWKEDLLVFLGDETSIADNDSNPVLRRLAEEQTQAGQTDYIMDYVEDSYRNISGIFKAAEKEVRREIQFMIDHNDFEYNLYKVDRNRPFDGLFERDGQSFRYTVNHTKKEFFDMEAVLPVQPEMRDKAVVRGNPLPLLMAFGESASDDLLGLWLGDQIEVTDEPPAKTYKDMSEKYIAIWPKSR